MTKLTNILKEIEIRGLNPYSIWKEVINLVQENDDIYYLLKDMVEHKIANKPYDEFYNEHDGMLNDNIDISNKFKQLYNITRPEDFKVFIAEDSDNGDELDISKYKHMVSFGTGFNSAEIYLTKF